MIEIGYKLSSEEFGPHELVRMAGRAEETGFSFAMISDHYHPWIDRQGHSPFVWAVLGGIAHATERLRVGTAVTCPSMRIHPAIVAQAAATTAAMMPGRFMFGVGSGENLNEHILGDHWPPAPVRLEMLEEAIDVIRSLWSGKRVSHRGSHYTVENARLYTLADDPPPVLVAAAGAKSASLAGRLGDGLISIAPSAKTVERFRENGGKGKPCYAEITVCWAQDENEARKLAFERWPIPGLKGQLSQELALPAHFESAHEMLREEDVADNVACGPDPDVHLQLIEKYSDAGFDHLFIHQIGPDQEGFFRFYEDSVLPKL